MKFIKTWCHLGFGLLKFTHGDRNGWLSCPVGWIKNRRMAEFKERSDWMIVEWWNSKSTGWLTLEWRTNNMKSWQWNGGPKREVYFLPFLGIKVCWLHWGLVWKLSRCRNSLRSHCCNPEVFLFKIWSMCVCLRVCLCVLAYVAVDLCGSLCVVTVDSCLFCIVFGKRQKKPPSSSLITGIESFFSSHGWLLHSMLALAMGMPCGGAGVAGKTGSDGLWVAVTNWILQQQKKDSKLKIFTWFRVYALEKEGVCLTQLVVHY